MGWALAIVGLVVAAVYQDVRYAELLNWDDDINIQNNVHLRGLTWENVRWMFTDVAYVRRYMPLAWLDWAIDHELFGLTARSCHVGNVLLHAVNSILVFFLIRKILRLWLSTSGEAMTQSASVAATLCALGWAIHPLRVEVVAWASGRIYCQTAFFMLLSTLSYLQMATTPIGTARRRLFWWGAIIALGMSLLTYPLAVTHVGVLLILDIWILKRFRPTAGAKTEMRPTAILLEKIPFVLVTAAVLAATLWARLFAEGLWQPPPTLEQFGVASRIMQGFYIWCYYLWKPLWPLDLAPVYTTLVWFQPGDAPFLASLAVVVLITAALIWKHRQWPGALALWLIHLVMLTPMLGLTEHPHYPNDRYSYLVAVPWSIALALVLVRLWNRPVWRTPTVVLILIALTGSGVTAARQVAVWRDSETLFRHLLQHLGDNPYRYDIAMRLGNFLGAQGKLADAVTFFTESLRINPRSYLVHNGLAKALEEQGKTDLAVTHFSIAAGLDPNWAEPHERLGRLLVRTGRATEAIGYLARAVHLTTEKAEIRLELGIALMSTGRAQEAMTQLQNAVQLNPALAEAHFNLGLAYRDTGRVPEARAQFETTLRLKPDFAAARDALTRLPAP